MMMTDIDGTEAPRRLERATFLGFSDKFLLYVKYQVVSGDRSKAGTSAQGDTDSAAGQYVGGTGQ